MQIQWFPGHMHKARVQMQATLPQVDLVIEVLDARIPFSSQNPMLAELRGDKPVLRLLNKSDLADPEWTKRWLSELDSGQGHRARAVTTETPRTIRAITGHCLEMFPDRAAEKPIVAMIAGIPNVGKSTLINLLAGKKVAKTGNEPAVTRGQQRIHIGQGVTLLDTPGVLWPNVENIPSGFRLAAIGSVKETAMEYADVAFFLAPFLSQHYFEALQTRYGLDSQPTEPLELIEAIGRRRGCLGKAGVVDLDRASKILITELRSGKLGPLTLETPEMMHQEIRETAARLAERSQQKRERQQQRKADFKQKQKQKPSRRRRR